MNCETPPKIVHLDCGKPWIVENPTGALTERKRGVPIASDNQRGPRSTAVSPLLQPHKGWSKQPKTDFCATFEALSICGLAEGMVEGYVGNPWKVGRITGGASGPSLS